MLNTIDVPKPVLKYPELRKSSNTSKFQANLRPRSHSREMIDRSKSNLSRNTICKNQPSLGINLKNFAGHMESGSHLEDSAE
jgi:hypothetical protein